MPLCPGPGYAGGIVIPKSTAPSDTMNVTLSLKEFRVIEELRKTPFGEITVIMHDAQPRRIERVKEKVQL